MRWLGIFAVLLAQPAGWIPPAVRIQKEGDTQGYASTLNCVGAGISCSVGASVATVSVTGSGGGSATPGGINGNVQINSGGSFGAYTGTTCAYAVKSLDANGAAACTAAPSIPADVSGAHYVTTQAEAGLSAEAVLPTCTGTDKLTFNGTTISCATDQTGAGAGTGACAANQYATALNSGAAPTCAQVAYAQVSGTPTIPADVSSKKYLIQTADAALPNAQAMGALGTGLVKNTTATGVQSIAVSGTDYAPATSGSSVLKGNGAGGFSNAVSGTDYQAPLTLPLSVGNGGLGAAVTPAAGTIVYGSSATAHAELAAGIAGQGLYSGGAGAPTWADAPKLVRLTSDYTNATTTLSNTALTWTSPAAVSRSAFDCGLMVKSSTTTTGGQFDVNVSVAPTTITYELEYVTAAGTAPSTGGTKVFVQATAIATLLGPATTALTTYTLWRLRGVIIHTASAATVTVRGKAGAAGTLTVSQGSYCSYYSL